MAERDVDISTKSEILRNKLKGQINVDPSRRTNVLVIGRPGAGKSSLVTTLRHCLMGSPVEEVAPAGVMQNNASYTLRLRKYKSISHLMNLDLSENAPDLLDMPGLPDVNDDRIRAILRCVMQGSVPEGEGFEIVQEEDILNRYQVNPENIIDRVIFVHSCRERIPQNLIDALFSVCDSLNVIVFSLLTHIDLPDQQCAKSELENALRTTGAPRSFEAELYHTKSDGEYVRIPQTEHTALLLWKSLLNPEYTRHSIQRQA